MAADHPPTPAAGPPGTGDDRPTIPRPGSDEALDSGCRCPVMDNGHGRGYMGQKGVYVMAQGCPLHWPADRSEPIRWDASGAVIVPEPSEVPHADR